MTMALDSLAPLRADDLAAPPQPRTVAETGLSVDQIEQLMMKTLHTGELTGIALSERVGLPYSLLEPLIERLRAERLIEVRGATGSGTAGFRYALTDLGRDRATQYLEINRYVGPAPVSLASYVSAMDDIRQTRGFIDRERLQQGFSHLVISDSLFDQLGPAANAGKAIFLFGPPGNGKTVIGEGLGRALGGHMYVPYALDVEGQIVTVFDPICHEIFEEEGPTSRLIAEAPRDRRWVRIRRPIVIVGGELTLPMLDLNFNPIAKYHEAPLQLKANGGVLLIDDFGRQRMRPEDLLNRWIVPLESRVDYLTLHSGKKFQVPFDVLSVFATNLDPKSLADEAFLRRIPYKIAVGDPTPDQFSRIFELNCEQRQLRFHQVMVAYLQRRHYGPAGRPLRACQPRDLIDQITALCRYRGVKPVITRELIDAACTSYFVDQSPEMGPEMAFTAGPGVGGPQPW
jgi:hypothetical protein